MSFTPVKGAEPIPGYQLVERLGTGGYGAVWKATAPGGLTKAIKIVFGEMGGLKADQELRALQRIKEVRHPFLLSLERIEVVDGQLLIVTELAEESLQDCFERCRSRGLPGIPREELLGQLRDAADALDYMSEVHGLQHLDIKPQNLLLVGGRIKVADFGLVKDLLGTSVTATGGVTPLYAPPEAFDGRISRYCDQYSLAVVYQEMLTGIRPFPGTTLMQLAQQHLNGRPLLDPLPTADRSVIARALAKTPQDRFPSCRAMVDQLLAARAGRPPVVEAPRPPASLPPKEALLGRPTEIVPVPTVPVPSRPAEWCSRETLAFLPPGVSGPPQESRSTLRPTLFVGVGGLAGQTLRRLKRRLHRQLGGLAAVPELRLLLIDADRADLRAAMQGEPEMALSAEETLLTPLQAQEYYRDQARDHLRWLDRRWFYGIPRDRTTEGLRPIGRLALVDNAAAVLTALRQALTQIEDRGSRIADRESKERPPCGTGILARAPSAGQECPAHLRSSILDPRSSILDPPRSSILDPPRSSIRVFLLGSVGGGTSGMLLDLAYAIQQLLEELHLPRQGLCGVLLSATSQKPAEVELARVNTRATLRELHHFSQPDQCYPGEPEHGLSPAAVGQPPFPECYLVHLGDGLSRDAAAAATDLVADYLYLNTVTTAGALLDQYRVQTRTGGPLALRTFGLDRIIFSRRLLARHAAHHFCRNVLESWRGEVNQEDRQEIEQACRNQARELGLEEERLIDRLNTEARTILGENPETLFLRLVSDSDTEPGTEAVLRRLDHALDAETAEASGITTLHPLKTAFSRIAEEVGSLRGQQLRDWLLSRVEGPEQRLKGAECAAGWFVEHLRGAAELCRTRLTQLRSYRQVLRTQLAREESGSRLLPLFWLRAGRERSGLKKRTKRLLDYCCLRLTEIAYESADRLLGVINHTLSPLVQELMLSQRKLTHFAAEFVLPPEEDDPGSPPPHLTELYFGAAPTLAEAVTAVLDRLTPEQVRQFEENFQAEVLDPEGGVWGLLASSAEAGEGRRATASVAFWALLGDDNTAARALKEKLLERAEQFLLNRLEDVDAAGLFVGSLGESNQLGPSVAAHVRAAQPELPVAGGSRHLLLLTPASSSAAALREQVMLAAGDLPVTVLEAGTDVHLCVEAAGHALPAVAAALSGEVQEELVQRVLARTDVDWSPL